MAYFVRKPVQIEAITFDELVQHGINSHAPLVNGLPWSFNYKGHAVTHQTDDVYLVSCRTGSNRFCRGDMLITGTNGEVYPCPRDAFEQGYQPVF